MVSFRSAALSLLVLMSMALLPLSSAGVVVHRIGGPFAAAERDSLQRLGIDVVEIPWSFSQTEEALELDSLAAGSLQPNFFDEDENIALTALSRGGQIWITVYAHDNNFVGQVLLDGDESTAYEWDEVTQGGTSLSRTTLDLGGQFLVKRVKFRPRGEHPERFLEGFTIGARNTVFEAFRVPYFPAVSVKKAGSEAAPAPQIRENTDAEIEVLIEPPHGVLTRFLQLRADRKTPKAIELAEFEVFGGGFVGRASYMSDVIELGDIASWGDITWSGRRDPEAEINIRTRAGADRHPVIYWEARPEQQDSVQFRGGGGNLTAKEYKAAYDRLPDVFKPGVVVTTGEGGGIGGVAIDETNRVSPDRENWSFWSSPYEFEKPGSSVVSPAPRQYFQITADFTSTSEDGGKLDYIEFKASVPPAVRGVIGEVFPVQTEVGKVTRFTYYIRPTIRAGDLGFDSIEISTPSGFASVDSLRLEGVDQPGFAWRPTEASPGFEVTLPRRMEQTESGAVIELVFSAPVLREVGTEFDGKVFDSARPHEVRQRVAPGNAADEVEGDVLSVKTSLSKSILFSPRVVPNPFSPNGDGVNDILGISYTLLRITAPVPVSVAIYDLSGRLVKQVHSGDDAIGDHDRFWNGTNRSNRLVPPGVYLYRLSVDTHTEEEVRTGLVSVAY